MTVVDISSCATLRDVSNTLLLNRCCRHASGLRILYCEKTGVILDRRLVLGQTLTHMICSTHATRRSLDASAVSCVVHLDSCLDCPSTTFRQSRRKRRGRDIVKIRRDLGGKRMTLL